MNRNGHPKTLWMMLAMLFCHTVAHADSAIMVENAWVRDAPPNAEMNAGYLTITNHSNHTLTLEAVSSPQFKKVEVHRTQMINGQVRMERISDVTIVAHGSLDFKPGAYHLMLIHPVQALKLGDTVELRLQFKEAENLTVHAPIRESAEEAPSHDMGNMHDMNM